MPGLRKLIILGAGASRAAGVDAERRRVPLTCLPPLNADFFTHLQRITETKHRETVRKAVADVVELFGSNFSLTLEDYFTQLEFLLDAVDIASRNPDLDRRELVARRNNLMAALGAVLESSTNEIINSKQGCPLHRDLLAHLTSADSIVSFNYDCLIDDVLSRYGDNKWNPRWGYAFPTRQAVDGLDRWSPKKPARGRKESLRLFKLHGSVNWQLPKNDRDPIHLKSRIHRQRGTPRFSIIPPVSNKSLGGETAEATIFRAVWRRCARQIRNADVIAVVGFSFAQTDLYAQSLFRIAVQKNRRLKLLVLAVPGSETRRRIRGVFDVPLAESDVLVRQYEDFRELVDHLPAAFG